MPRAHPDKFIPAGMSPGNKPSAKYTVYVDNELVLTDKSRLKCVSHAIRMLKERPDAKKVFYAIEYPVRSERDRILMSWTKVNGAWRAGAVAA